MLDFDARKIKPKQLFYIERQSLDSSLYVDKFLFKETNDTSKGKLERYLVYQSNSENCYYTPPKIKLQSIDVDAKILLRTRTEPV